MSMLAISMGRDALFDPETLTLPLKGLPPSTKSLRSEGKKVEVSYRKGGLKKQLEFAHRIGAQYAVIVGVEDGRRHTCIRQDCHSKGSGKALWSRGLFHRP